MLDHIPTPNPLEKKLYQLIISRLDGESLSSGLYQEEIFELVRKGIGGFIIFGGEKDEVKYFIDKIQSISEIPLFIASDIERGVGQQIQDNTLFPCQMAMAAAIDKNRPEDVAILESAIRAIADEARYIGINMPLIPVLDVNQNPDNSIICTRAFSDNPEDVAWFGSEYIRIVESSGLISCAKHFPGHGDTSTDSHILLPVINKSYEDLMNIDIVPFKEAINKGVSSIMIGHLSIQAIDYKPASLSKRVIIDLLRKELGFDGLILTDALNMKALEGFKNVSTECIKAGADILLHPLDVDLTVKELISAVESKEITEKQIDEAVSRILRTKEKLQNTTTPLCPPLACPASRPAPLCEAWPGSEAGVRGELKGGKVDYQRHKILSSQITYMSISLFKNTPGVLPIPDESRICVVFAGDDKFFESSPLKRYFKNVSMINENLVTSFPSFIRKLNPPSPPLVKGGKGGFSGEVTVFAIFTSVAAWIGSSGIGEDEKSRISEFIRNARNSTVISFGSPYVLRHFREADLLVAAYETTEQAQTAVIKCLEGNMDFKGRLPVKLNLNVT